MILHREYLLKSDTVFDSDNIGKIELFKNLPERFRRRLSLVKGHLYYGVHQYIPRPVQYFTLLRKPLERTISLYNYLMAEPNTPFYKELNEKQYSLDQLFENGYILNIDNCQVRFLCGAEPIPFGQVNEIHLQMAIDNLSNHYDAVGISERFDESILLFARKFNWGTPWYTRQNEGRGAGIKLSELKADTLEKLQYYNRYDEILYQRALELFQEELNAAGPGFMDEVAAFKKENELRMAKTKRSVLLMNYVRKLRFYLGLQKM
jgi:hypothetical protein